MKKILEKHSGITLVSLTITIIILITLAGITILSLSGDNGIISRAKQAKNKYNDEQIKEKIQTTIMQATVRKKGPNITFMDIADELIEEKMTQKDYVISKKNLVLTTDGVLLDIRKNKIGEWKVEIVGNKNQATLVVDHNTTPEQATPVVTIDVKAIQVKDGIKKIIMPDGTEKTYTEKDIFVEEKYEVAKNGTYTFYIESNAGEIQDYNVTVENIEEGAIAIVPSTEEWTNQDIEVEVIWPLNSENFTKEVSKDGGTTYQTYTDKITVSENCKIVARLKFKNEIIKEENLEISNIDKEAPTAEITLAGVTFGVDAKIVTSYTGSETNIAGCKYILNNTATAIGEEESLYTEGNLQSETTTIKKAKSAGTYYLHVLLKDKIGNKREVISSNSVTVASVLNFDYTGQQKQVDLLPGNYKLEVWGAQGGYRSSTSYGGKGGYSVGTLNLSNVTTLYAVVGGAGNTGGTSGGYNGGGSRDSYNGGGGGTDFRINSNSLYARVIVAGGGGSDGAQSNPGYYGGGTSGGSATESYGSGGQGATQTSGGSGSSGSTQGSFGQGGTGYYYANGYAGAGGRRLVWRSRKLSRRFC